MSKKSDKCSESSPKWTKSFKKRTLTITILLLLLIALFRPSEQQDTDTANTDTASTTTTTEKSNPSCLIEACAYCMTNAENSKQWCTECVNGSFLQEDKDTPSNNKCVFGLEIENCWSVDPRQPEKCLKCKRGYYINKDRTQCLRIRKSKIQAKQNCLTGYESQYSFGVICSSCLNSLVSPDGKFCLNNPSVPDNCAYGGLVSAEHPFPCYMCNNHFYLINGYCEYSFIEGCMDVDLTTRLCLKCHAFKGFYAIGAFYSDGKVYQVCEYFGAILGSIGVLFALLMGF